MRPEVRHLANSAATLTNPAAHFDLVRPGIAVYGLSPVPDLGDPGDFGLRPAMTLDRAARPGQAVPAGQGVSYGHVYVTDRDTTLGLVPLGYADGIPRSAGAAARCSSAAGARRSRAGSAWTSSSSTSALTRRGAGDEVVLFGAAPTASRTRRTGPRPPAPSTTRS